jgi:hypothetical protein
MKFLPKRLFVKARPRGGGAHVQAEVPATSHARTCSKYCSWIMIARANSSMLNLVFVWFTAPVIAGGCF